MNNYRILFALDGIHWINNKKNNRKDPSQAVFEALDFVNINPFAKVKVINIKTQFKIFEGIGKHA